MNDLILKLQQMQKEDKTNEMDIDANVHCCWFDSLDTVIQFDKGDTFILNLFAWKPGDVWHNTFYLEENNHPISKDDIEELCTSKTISCKEKDLFLDFTISVTLKHDISSEAIVPLLFTAVTREMNKKNVAPREHFVESFSKNQPSYFNKNDCVYSVGLGT